MLKNVFILGDSYSTFEGHIPEGYVTYYRAKGPYYVLNEPKLPLTDNEVSEVSHTWWYNLIKENGTLVRNCSWSGTTICNTGYDGVDNSKISFIARMEKLLSQGFFEENKVDTLFLFGGTNDSCSNAPLGEKIYSDWTDSDLYNVFPAFTYLINLLLTKLTDTKIYCIMNSSLKPEVTEFYKYVCEKEGVDFIQLHDIEKIEGHPTVKGMMTIKEQILDYIKR